MEDAGLEPDEPPVQQPSSLAIEAYDEPELDGLAETHEIEPELSEMDNETQREND